MRSLLKIGLLVLFALGIRYFIGNLDSVQLAMLIGICFGLLAGVPLSIMLMTASDRQEERSKQKRTQRSWVKVNGIWEEIL